MTATPATSQPPQSDAESISAMSAHAVSYRSSRGRGQRDRPIARADSAVFVPIALLAAAMVIGLGFQCWQLMDERDHLEQAFASQVRVVENATQFRAKLDKVARETQQLADRGNPNAKFVVEELRKRGITINPTALPPSTSGAAPPGIGAPAK
jgi:hypothetical protein